MRCSHDPSPHIAARTASARRREAAEVEAARGPGLFGRGRLADDCLHRAQQFSASKQRGLSDAVIPTIL
jgi:hypothetical protein